MRSMTEVVAGPLRATPRRFRVLLGVGAAIVVLGYLAVLLLSSGPGPSELVRLDGFVLLAALVLLADLYPLLPWMRDVRANVTFAWSAALSLAAVLVYGPVASLLFLVSGLTAALSRGSGRWWRPALNMVTFGLVGLTVATLAALRPAANHSGQPTPLQLAVWGLGLAAVVVVLNALLIGLSLTELGVTTWPEQYERFGKAVRIWGVSLITAPLLAAMALDGPWALPSMALIIVSLNHLSRTMFRSTAQARTDPLTGLANRLTLIRRLSARIGRLDSDSPTVTLMLIDLNRFKAVNDTYGHLVGDEVLLAAAHRLQAAAASTDLVARYGGDEFAVVLGPRTTRAEVALAADRFRAALTCSVQVAGAVIALGGSVGIAETSDPRMDVLGLVEQADRDMYRAKWSADHGTDRVPGVPGVRSVRSVRSVPGIPSVPGIARAAGADAVTAVQAAPDPRGAAAPIRPRQPVWSSTVQGSASGPAAGWPAVQWSRSPWVGAWSGSGSGSGWESLPDLRESGAGNAQ